MLNAFWQYLRDFRDGKIPFSEFSVTMDKLRELADEASNALDATWMTALADNGSQARAFIDLMIREYEAAPELFAPVYAER